MANIKFSYMLIAGFLAVVLLAAGVSYYVQETERNTRIVIEHQAKIVADAERAAKYNLELFSYAESYILHETQFERDRIRSKFYDSFGKLSGKLDDLEDAGIDKYTLNLIRQYANETRNDFDVLAQVHDEMVVAGSEDIVGMEPKEEMATKAIEDKEFKVQGVRDMIVEAARRNMDLAVSDAEKKEQYTGILLAASVLLSLLISALIIREISRRFAHLREGARKVGEGDLDVWLDVPAKDEIGEVAEAFNKMTENLKKSTVSVREMDATVAKKTKELAAKNEELEKFNRLSVGRELKMIELKKKINELEAKLADKK